MLRLVFLCAFVTFVVCVQNNCTFTMKVNGTTEEFDLSPLTYDPSQPPPPNYQIVGADSNTYYINFCEQVSISLGCSDNYEYAACQKSGLNYFGTGAVYSQTIVPYIPPPCLIFIYCLSNSNKANLLPYK